MDLFHEAPPHSPSEHAPRVPLLFSMNSRPRSRFASGPVSLLVRCAPCHSRWRSLAVGVRDDRGSSWPFLPPVPKGTASSDVEHSSGRWYKSSGSRARVVLPRPLWTSTPGRQWSLPVSSCLSCSCSCVQRLGPVAARRALMSSRTMSRWASVGGELLVVAHVRPLPARSH